MPPTVASRFKADTAIWRCLFCLAVRLGSSMAPCKLFGRPLSRPPQARDSQSLIWSAAAAASAGQDLMLSQYYTSVLSQQQTSVLSQQQTSVLSQQQSQIRGWAQNHKNGPKWVENGRQASRIGQNESKHASGAFPTGPGAKNSTKKTRNNEIGLSGPPPSGSTPQEQDCS